MALTPLASLKCIDNRCLLCNFPFSKESNIVSVNLCSLQEISKRWSELPRQICTDAPYNEFIHVLARFPGKNNIKHDVLLLNIFIQSDV